MPTDDVNASGQTVITPPAAPELTDDMIFSIPEEKLKSHPAFKTLEEKHAAARQGMDKSNLSKKELQAENARLRVLAGVEEDQTPVEDDQPLTKNDLEKMNEDLRWDLLNAKDVELYGDEKFTADLQAGIPKAYALENAKLRSQSNPDKARLERQRTMASGSAASTRNLESDELTPAEQKGIAEGLYTKETALKHRELKRQRAQ